MRRVRRLRPLAAAWCGLLAVFAVGMGPAQADETAFVHGAAQANATIFQVKGQAGSASLGIGLGGAIARYQNIFAWGESRVLDFGLLEDFLTQSCDASAPLLAAETVDPPLRVDSRDPTSAAEGLPTAVRWPGSSTRGDVLGFQNARAASDPFGWAGTDLEPLNLAIVGISGARTEVSSRIVDGHTREAVAVSTVDRLDLLGFISIFGARWEAVHRSGAEAGTSASFTFDHASILGVDRSPAEAQRQITRIFADIEGLVGQVGVRMDYPEVVEKDGEIQITPLAFRVADSPLGRTHVAPVLEALHPIREVIFDILLENDCNFAGMVTLLDVALGTLAGSGGIHLEVGGATASTDDTDYSTTLGDVLGTTEGTGQDLQSTAGASGAPTADTGSVGSESSSSAVPPTDAPSATASAVRMSKTVPGERGGVALVAGAVSALGVLGLAVADIVSIRRGRRRIPEGGRV